MGRRRDRDDEGSRPVEPGEARPTATTRTRSGWTARAAGETVGVSGRT